MPYLTHLQSIWSTGLPGIGQVSDVLIRDTPSGPVLVLRNWATQTETTLPLTGAAISASAASVQTMGPTASLALLDGAATIGARFLADLMAGSGDERGYLDGSSFAGLSAHFAVAQIGGETLLFAAKAYGEGISVFSLASGVVARGGLADTAETHLSATAGLATARVGTADFLIAASADEDGLSVMRIGPGGALEAVHSLSAADGLPVSTPSGVMTVTVGSETYVILAASGTSSLTALRLDSNGHLSFADQVSDTLATRFQGATAFDWISYQGRTLIAVGGNDGGVSLLQLLPGGQFLHLETIVDQTNSALSGIRDLQFVVTGSGLQLLTLTTGDQGLGQFSVQLPSSGVVLVDAAGAGTLTGTAGADIFLYRPDGATDVISGFDPTKDKIDLSIYGLVGSFADLEIISTAKGARILIGDEILEIRSSSGGTLSAAILADCFLFDLDHTSVSDPLFSGAIYGTAFSEALQGSSGNDEIYGRGGEDWITPGAGNDIVDGGTENDMVSYVDLAGPVRIDLSQGTATASGKIDQLINIEGATGSIYNDYIVGDAGANRLRGLGGNDWFVGSGGGDSFDGGVGRDMVSYAYAPGGVTVDLSQGRGLAGQAEGDTYVSIERITGSSFADLFIGGPGADEFRGLGGDDWFVGSGSGRDRFDGGAGRDTVSYATSDAGVTASLLLGRGSAGDATSDRYHSIENLTGSSHDDTLTGDHGANVLRGLGGKDRLFGNGGDDTLTGGGGNDFIDGGAGWDSAIFSGLWSEYEITVDDGQTIVRHLNGGVDGVDTLVNVEVLIFDDLWITL